MDDIYIKIRQLREKLGFSQEDLAVKTGYTSRSSIAKIEKGEVDIPRSKILAFAKALKTTPGYLMGWEEENDQESKKEDDMVEIVFRMRSDSDFFCAVKILSELPPDKFQSIKQLLSSFSK